MYCTLNVSATEITFYNNYAFASYEHNTHMLCHTSKVSLMKVLHRISHRVSFGSFINSYQLSHPFNLHIDGFFVLFLLKLSLLSFDVAEGVQCTEIRNV